MIPAFWLSYFAPVTVNNAFATKAVQTIERDAADDEIISTTTTYSKG